MGDGPLAFRVWCGGLPNDVEEDELRDKFGRFGEIANVNIRSSAKDTFAFIQFRDDRAVDDAIEGMTGDTTLGPKVKVQRATVDRSKAGAGGGGRRSRSRSDSRHPAPRGGRQEPPRSHRRDDSRARGPEPRRNGRRGRRGHSPALPLPPPPPPSASRGGGRRHHRHSPSPPPRGGGGGGRGGYSPPPRARSDRGFSPAPGRHGGGSRRRSRTPLREDGIVRMAGKVPVGRYKIAIENLPEDMTWRELKDVAMDYSQTITFCRTFNERGQNQGMIEFKDKRDADLVVKELDRRRVQGSTMRLKAYHASS